MTETLYGRTPTGQLLYDLGFSRIKDSSIARKHHLPIVTVRRMRAKVRRALRPRRKKR